MPDKIKGLEERVKKLELALRQDFVGPANFTGARLGVGDQGDFGIIVTPLVVPGSMGLIKAHTLVSGNESAQSLKAAVYKLQRKERPFNETDNRASGQNDLLEYVTDKNQTLTLVRPALDLFRMSGTAIQRAGFHFEPQVELAPGIQYYMALGVSSTTAPNETYLYGSVAQFMGGGVATPSFLAGKSWSDPKSWPDELEVRFELSTGAPSFLLMSRRGFYALPV